MNVYEKLFFLIHLRLVSYIECESICFTRMSPVAILMNIYYYFRIKFVFYALCFITFQLTEEFSFLKQEILFSKTRKTKWNKRFPIQIHLKKMRCKLYLYVWRVMLCFWISLLWFPEAIECAQNMIFVGKKNIYSILLVSFISNIYNELVCMCLCADFLQSF